MIFIIFKLNIFTYIYRNQFIEINLFNIFKYIKNAKRIK